MGLAEDITHPVRRHYVLKLDREADPARGVLSGRVESLATGYHFEFVDLASLLDGLSRDSEPSGVPAP